jgi:hypothetical protein
VHLRARCAGDGFISLSFAFGWVISDPALNVQGHIGASVLRTNNAAAAAIYEGRQMLRTNGIFVSASIAKSFKEAFDKLSDAQVERYMEFQHGRSSGYEKSQIRDPVAIPLVEGDLPIFAAPAMMLSTLAGLDNAGSKLRPHRD